MQGGVLKNRDNRIESYIILDYLLYSTALTMLGPSIDVPNKTTSNASFDAVFYKKARILILVDLHKIQSIFEGNISSLAKLCL